MSRKKDLRKLSKNELIEIILSHEARLEEIEQHLRAFENPHTPSAKIRSKTNTNHDDTTRFPGKPENSNGGGIKMPPADKQENITKNNCPKCGKRLRKPLSWYRFKQIDIVVPQFITTQYKVGIYSCCNNEIDAGENLQKGFYGPNITALAGCLRKESLSHKAIANFFNDAYGLAISEVTIFNKLIELTYKLSPEKNKIARAINRSEFAHMDETGLRRDGKNGYVWNASTPKHCLFKYDKSISSEVAKRILTNFYGAIITDDYKGYLWHMKRQLCWAHLLRESKEYAENNGATAQHERLKNLYDRAKRSQLNSHLGDYDKLCWELEDIARCYRPLRGCRNMYSKLHKRTHLWLLGVQQKNIPLTNNHAERCLRKIVLQRNRIGCIRNQKGEEFINTFLTCTTTWNLQQKSTYQELLKRSS